MTLTIEIASETERLLQTEAERNGLSPDQFVQKILEEKFSKSKLADRGMKGVLQEMMAEGMISRIPVGVSAEDDQFEAVKMSGEPLSETILKDRD